MTAPPPAPSRFPRFGENPVVDFVNTAPVDQGVAMELLGSPKDLLEWVMAVGRISPDEAARVEAQPVPRNLMAQAHELRESLRGIFQSRVSGLAAPLAALEVLNRWLAEPTTVQGPGRLVERATDNNPTNAAGDGGIDPETGPADLDAKRQSTNAAGDANSEAAANDGLSRAGGSGQDSKSPSRFELVVPAAAMGWHGILPDLARDAATLLTGHDLRHLKRCESPACVLFFLDLSRNGRRRWCSMKLCGNRHKVAAHYRRKHPEPPPPTE